MAEHFSLVYHFQIILIKVSPSRFLAKIFIFVLVPGNLIMSKVQRKIIFDHSSHSLTHPATYSPLKYLLVPEKHSTPGLNSSFSCIPHAFFIATALATNLEYPTWELQERRTDIGRHCNSVETAQPGDRTTDHGIVMPERYQSS